MARHEQDREDLMREATALRQRLEVTIPGESDSIVAGFRSSGTLSVYFGGDAAYQFDETGALRRAFHGGRLYRSQGHTLARLTRERSDTETALLRHDLSAAELQAFLDEMCARLNTLRDALESGSVHVLAQIPPAPDLQQRLHEALTAALAPPARLTPALKG